MDPTFILFGSYGYTGSLIADLAVQRGMHPILSGRDHAKLKKQADRLGLQYRSVSVDDPIALEAAIADTSLVLSCAGPFIHTYKPIVQACLKTRKHYLDITGEIAIFESLATCDEEAKQAGVMLLPGVGFDVVPSDCLAAHLKKRLPQATHLAIAFHLLGQGFSQGTALTATEGIPGQGLIRKEGKLTQVPFSWKNRQIDFGYGPKTAICSPWGDVSTAFYSTGIPNIEEYMVRPKSLTWVTKWFQPLMGLSAQPSLRRLLKRIIKRMPPGPSEAARRRGQCRLWGEAGDAQGYRIVSRMETPEAYSLTAMTALLAVTRVLSGEFKPGYQTPSLAFGPDFILEIDGVKREDVIEHG